MYMPGGGLKRTKKKAKMTQSRGWSVASGLTGDFLSGLRERGFPGITPRSWPDFWKAAYKGPVLKDIGKQLE